jgi:predicted HTH transcriptional regulator
MAVGARIEGWKRIDLPEYPIEALREAVVNAVIHRDYSKMGESIRVFYYIDRVEIHSPGLLLPGIKVEQMERGEVQSKPLEENKPQQLVLDVLPVTTPQFSPGTTALPDVDKRRAMAMRYVQEHGSITNRDYRELTGVSEQTANRDLEALVVQGGLTKVGEKRGRRYRLP